MKKNSKTPVPVDPKKVEARKKGRESAKEVFEYLDYGWPDNYGADYADSLLTTLKELLPQKAVDQPEEKKPTPIARLGTTVIWYGEFKGKTFDEVPIDRLQWYLKVSEDNVKELKEYLTHPELEGRRRGL